MNELAQEERTTQSKDMAMMRELAQKIDNSPTGSVDVKDEVANKLSIKQAQAPEPVQHDAEPKDFEESGSENNGQPTTKPKEISEPLEERPDKQAVSKDEASKKPKTEKDKERQDRSWEALNKDKDAFYKEKQTWQAEKSKFDTHVNKLMEENKELKQFRDTYESRPDVTKVTPEGYEYLAKQAEESGEYEQARAYKEKAHDLRLKIKEFEQSTKSQQEDFTRVRNKTTQELLSEFPELRDTKHPLHLKALDYITFERDPAVANFLKSIPHGERYAVELAKMSLAAEENESLRDEVAELRKKLKSFEEKTTLAGSYKSSPKKPKSLDNMPREEALSALRRKAEDHDSGSW